MEFFQQFHFSIINQFYFGQAYLSLIVTVKTIASHLSVVYFNLLYCKRISLVKVIIVPLICRILLNYLVVK